MSYWDNTGKYQTEYERFNKILVPMSGNCATVEGENLRAISNIYHDYFNNGFMNNFTGALKWLIRQDLIKRDEVTLIRPWANSQMPDRCDFDDNAPIPLALEAIVNRVLEDIIKHEPGGFRPNTANMLDLSDRDDLHDYPEEEENDWDDYPDDDEDYLDDDFDDD